MDLTSYTILVGITSFLIAFIVCLIVVLNTGNDAHGFNIFMAWAIFLVAHCIFMIICSANFKDYETIHQYNIVSHNNEDYYIDEDNKIITIGLNNKERYYTDKPSYVEFKEAKFLWLTDTKVTYYINIEGI